MARYLVKFGFYVEADTTEAARELAKHNLYPEGNRASIDTFDIAREFDANGMAGQGKFFADVQHETAQHSPLEPEDEAEFCEDCEGWTVIDSKCHECGREYDDR